VTVQPGGGAGLLQVEVIDLTNDGSGLGFGIVGSKDIGVVIKTIIAGCVSARVIQLACIYSTRTYKHKLIKITHTQINLSTVSEPSDKKSNVVDQTCELLR